MDRERIIVLKKTVYRDSDLIIRGLNSQGAKLSFIAPAALKSRRRFGGGVLEPTNFIEVVYQVSRRSSISSSSSQAFTSSSSLSESSLSLIPPARTPPSSSSSLPFSALSSSYSMPRLQEAQMIKEFQGLRRSYELIQVGLSLLELVDRVSQDGIQHGEELFNLLGHGLQCLTQLEESSLISFRLQFLLKFLFQQGVLEQESWMDLFLRTPLRDHSLMVQELHRSQNYGTNTSDSLMIDRLAFIERQVKAYKETGAL